MSNNRCKLLSLTKLAIAWPNRFASPGHPTSSTLYIFLHTSDSLSITRRQEIRALGLSYLSLTKKKHGD